MHNRDDFFVMNKYDDFFMDTAKRSALMSYCNRKKVGAVLVKDKRILINSWNGTFSGSKCNACEDENGNTLPEVIHAEQNIICFASKYGIATKECIMYCTLSPCDTCAALIIQSGIKEVVYDEVYRNTTGIDILKNAGVVCRQIKQS